jgi:hypothetical protein
MAEIVGIMSHFDGIEFDMGDRVQQGGQAFWLEGRAPRHLRRMDEFRPGGAARQPGGGRGSAICYQK